MTANDVEKYAEELRALIEERLRLKAPTLERALKKAGRLLPKRAQRDGMFIVEVQGLMSHPKLRATVDEAKVAKAHGDLVAHLKTIDPKERRTNNILSTLGSVGFSVLMVLIGLMAVLMWRGFV